MANDAPAPPTIDPKTVKWDSGTPTGNPVIDPNSVKWDSDRSIGDTVAGYGNSVVGGVNQGIARTVGMPMDLYNLIGNVAFGSGPAWVADKLGYPDTAAAIRKNGYQPINAGSSQNITDLEKKAGIGYTAQTPGEQGVKDLASGVTTGALTSAIAPLAVGAIPALGAVPRAYATSLADAVPAAEPAVAAAAAKGGIAGGGASIGGDAAKGINKAAGSPLPDGLAELGGAFIGGGLSSMAGNRTTMFEKSPIVQDADAAGVKLGTPGAQQQVSDFAKRSLGAGDVPTIEQQGTAIQGYVGQAIEKLKGSVAEAYDHLNTVIPKTMPVDTNSTRMALTAALDDVQNPGLKAALQNPVAQRFEDAFKAGKADQLTWAEMDAFRREIGSSLNGAVGSEMGALKTLYRGINDDMRTAAAGAPGGSVALGDALATVKKRNDALDDILTSAENKNPENLPAWLMAESQKGSTRLDNLKGNMSDDQWNELGRWMMNNRAQGADGAFDPSMLGKALTPGTKPGMLSPEARSSLIGDGTELDDSLSRFGRLQGELSNPPVSAPSSLGKYVAGGAGTALTASLMSHGLDPILHGGDIAALLHTAAGAVGGGLMSKIPSANPYSRLLYPTGDTTSFMQGGAMGARSTETAPMSKPFSDVYVPQKHSDIETPAPGDVKKFVQSAPKEQVVAYIGSKLGPDITKQIPADQEGHDAAINALLMQPRYSSVLLG